MLKEIILAQLVVTFIKNFFFGSMKARMTKRVRDKSYSYLLIIEVKLGS